MYNGPVIYTLLNELGYSRALSNKYLEADGNI